MPYILALTLDLTRQRDSFFSMNKTKVFAARPFFLSETAVFEPSPHRVNCVPVEPGRPRLDWVLVERSHPRVNWVPVEPGCSRVNWVQVEPGSQGKLRSGGARPSQGVL